MPRVLMIMKKRFMFFFLLHVVSMSSTIVISLTLSVDMWIRFFIKNNPYYRPFFVIIFFSCTQGCISANTSTYIRYSTLVDIVYEL